MKKTYLTETTIAFVVSVAAMYAYTWWSAETIDEKIQVLSAMSGIGTAIFLGGAARKVGEKFAGNSNTSPIITDPDYQEGIPNA